MYIYTTRSNPIRRYTYVTQHIFVSVEYDSIKTRTSEIYMGYARVSIWTGFKRDVMAQTWIVKFRAPLLRFDRCETYPNGNFFGIVLCCYWRGIVFSSYCTEHYSDMLKLSNVLLFIPLVRRSTEMKNMPSKMFCKVINVK